MYYFELNLPSLESAKPVAVDAQEWVHAAEYFLVERETAEKDMRHFELTSVALGWEHQVSKAGEAFQAFGAVVVVVVVVVVVEEVHLVLMVVPVEKTLQVSGSVVEEGTLVLMEAAAGETHWVSEKVAAVKEPLVLMEVADEEIHQVFGAAVAEQETVVSVDQVG